MSAETQPDRKLQDGSNAVLPLDILHIDVNHLASIRAWCRALSCTEQEIREAVRTVGTSGAAVRRHLGR